MKKCLAGYLILHWVVCEKFFLTISIQLFGGTTDVSLCILCKCRRYTDRTKLIAAIAPEDWTTINHRRKPTRSVFLTLRNCSWWIKVFNYFSLENWIGEFLPCFITSTTTRALVAVRTSDGRSREVPAPECHDIQSVYVSDVITRTRLMRYFWPWHFWHNARDNFFPYRL